MKNKLLEMMLKYGCIMNFNADTPGGMVSDAGTPSDSGITDTVETAGADNPDSSGDSGDDQGTPDGEGTSDDASSSDDGSSQSPPAIPDTSAALQALSDKIDGMTNTATTTDSGNDGDNDQSFEHGDLVAMMADNPAEFLANLTERVTKSVRAEVMEDAATREYNSKVENVVGEYADKNPTFEKMWEDKSIQKFMESNPGHNAISAHMSLTMEDRVNEAKKTGAEEAIKNYDTKRSSQVLNGGPGIPPNQRDDALKNPQKYGGRAAVIAARAGIQ